MNLRRIAPFCRFGRQPTIIPHRLAPTPAAASGFEPDLIFFSRGLRNIGNTMTVYWLWWVAAALLIVAELLTGTFYLLVMGVAVACAGVAAVLGASLTSQWLVAGVLGVVGIAAIQRWRHRNANARPVQQALDIGAPVQVLTWGPNHTARVAYRGTRWDAELASPDTPQAETMYIADMRGSVLILADRRPGTPQAAA
jgi:membrane protein implicated in regulation of membrane protease activity